ncbi:hypothetical protein M011DRAFT_475265 [Sporormia fimetaria CBS 119925]|uniref:Uncharacterized protein n=1 Tax=Sporormia fimetaria CBS 119925 TaxID=1340428 RepID=A0A6A6VH85_9PLEO|nr:hypothetical protein M011DRAFT_475265 [Sporormia fimetaria CBS 119925]
MSSYAQFYQYLDQGQLLDSTNVLSYGYDDRRREKSPSSMVNHSGHSPGPLSTPPHSRNTSQPPEQPPDQMVYDDLGGSQSDSPVTVPTPDVDVFELELLDSDAPLRAFYYQQGNNMTSTHVQEESIPALTTNFYLPSQVLSESLVATQNQQYQASLAQQSPLLQLTSQPPEPLFSQGYTTQPVHHDPWPSQRPHQNPILPQSGGVLFDPETDPTDYANWINFDVDQWINNHPEPDVFTSPSEPTPTPFSQSGLFSLPAHPPQDYPTHRPRIGVVVPSPPPRPQPYLNQNLSPPAIVHESVTQRHVSPVSPNASAVWSSGGQLPSSPYQIALSPQASVHSPGGSEGALSSYNHSDSGVPALPAGESTVSEPSDAKTRYPSSAGSVSEGYSDVSPEPDSRPRRRAGRGSGRPGGRAHGTHLDPEVAKQAHQMRQVVACWHCVLQRDRCGPGDICERCLKRANRPNADCGLGCSRVRLTELSYEFLPTLVTQMHEDAFLMRFANKHIRQWHNVEITATMTCGQRGMPRIKVQVYEFVPTDEELLLQIQYHTDKKTGARYPVTKRSPALGMVHINHNEEKRYDQYVDLIVNKYIDEFADLCWREDDNDFQQRFFTEMTKVKTSSGEEATLVREVCRLLVVTFIMSHTITLAEEDKYHALSKMHSFSGQYQDFTSPRMTNRQLKYFFAHIQRKSLSAVLNKLQQIFKSSKGCDKWLAAFIGISGLCMALEDQQMTIHQVMETQARTEGIELHVMQAKAEAACRDIDAQIKFLHQLFRWKYNRKYNPLLKHEDMWVSQDEAVHESQLYFLKRVAQLVKENIDFLQTRSSVSICHANQSKYTSRLVGQFLLSFWYPMMM